MKRAALLFAVLLCAGCAEKSAFIPGERAYLVTHGEGWDDESHEIIPAGTDTVFSENRPSQWRYSIGHFWKGGGEFLVRFPITVTDLCGDTLWTLAETQAKAETERRRERAEAIRRSLGDCK